jgi:DNA-directed RNA polymerase specialized sigma24 family protein
MQGTTDTLRGIIEQLSEGSETAFEELYRKLSGRVFSYLIPRVKSREEALDVMQEIFLAI